MLEREIFEEVGIKVKGLEYVNSSSFITDTGFHVVNIVFLCEYEAGEAFAKSPDEVNCVFWFSTDQIISAPELPVYLKRNIEFAESLLRTTISLE